MDHMECNLRTFHARVEALPDGKYRVTQINDPGTAPFVISKATFDRWYEPRPCECERLARRKYALLTARGAAMRRARLNAVRLLDEQIAKLDAALDAAVDECDSSGRLVYEQTREAD